MAIYIRDKQGDLTALNIPAINGKSAYEVALSNGFVGTEKEWLKSLKGENGSEEVYIGTAEGAPSTASMVIDPEEDNEYDGFFTDSKYDYLGKEHSTLKAVNDSNIEHVLRRVNVQKYEGSSITANNTYMKQVNNVILKGVTKYRDKVSNELGDRFQEGQELISVKNPILTIKNKREGVSEGLITFSGHDEAQLINVIDSSNFTIKTTGKRNGGAKTNPFFIQDLGGAWRSKFIIEFDGKLLSGDLSNTIGVQCVSWSTFISGYNGKLPVDGKYRAVVECSSNPPNRSTVFMITPSSTSTTANVVEYQIRNLKIYPVKNNHETFQSNKVIINGEFGAVNDCTDTLNLVTGEVVYRTALRQYQEGDETNNQVVTDMRKTRYILDQPITQHIDLQGQKIYSYDGTTYYTCQSELGYPAPILSMEIPTDLASLVQEERAINQKLYNDQNIIINSQLSLYESMSDMLLKDNDDIVPEYIQNLYKLAYERGIRIRKQEVDINEDTR